MTDRVVVPADPWFVPANLADFECAHGKLPGECPDCDGADAEGE